MTGKSSGIVRCHYGVPSLAAMAWHGVQVFGSADEIFGTDIGFRQTGYIVGVGENNTGPLAANVTMHRELGVPVESIDATRSAGCGPESPSAISPPSPTNRSAVTATRT